MLLWHYYHCFLCFEFAYLKIAPALIYSSDTLFCLGFVFFMKPKWPRYGDTLGDVVIDSIDIVFVQKISLSDEYLIYICTQYSHD